MAAELVNSATSSKLAEMDWTKNIEICELAANDQKYIIFNAFVNFLFPKYGLIINNLQNMLILRLDTYIVNAFMKIAGQGRK